MIYLSFCRSNALSYFSFSGLDPIKFEISKEFLYYVLVSLVQMNNGNSFYFWSFPPSLLINFNWTLLKLFSSNNFSLNLKKAPILFRLFLSTNVAEIKQGSNLSNNRPLTFEFLIRFYQLKKRFIAHSNNERSKKGEITYLDIFCRPNHIIWNRFIQKFSSFFVKMFFFSKNFFRSLLPGRPSPKEERPFTFCSEEKVEPKKFKIFIFIKLKRSRFLDLFSVWFLCAKKVAEKEREIQLGEIQKNAFAQSNMGEEKLTIKWTDRWKERETERERERERERGITYLHVFQVSSGSACKKFCKVIGKT